MLYCNPINSGPTSFSTYNTTKLIGQVTEINENSIGFNFTSQNLTVAQLNSIFNATNNFITFKKNLAINSSSLKGYYALCNFVNDDFANKNELFAVGSEISVSSK